MEERKAGETLEMAIAMPIFLVALDTLWRMSAPSAPQHKGPQILRALVAHAGFEPAISALRGRRPGPLDEWAVYDVGDSTSKHGNCQTLVTIAHFCMSAGRIHCGVKSV